MSLRLQLSDFGSGQECVSQLDVRPTQNWNSLCRNKITSPTEEMTPKEEMSPAVQDQLGCVTTCCICDETYSDPVILPCTHTFCLACLQHIGTRIDKNPGDAMPCLLCRQEFTIPDDGFAALKKNFFMVRLIEIIATKQGASGECDKHEHENLCLYCSECNEVLCMVCLRECHSNHRLADLSSAANNLRSQLQSNIGTAKECMSDALKKKERLLQRKCAVFENIQDVETEVYKARCDLKALIDRHADSLLNDLGFLKKKQIEDIEIEEKELSKHLDCLKNFEIYCAELAVHDRHDNLFCTMANELKEQIVELKLLNKSIAERQLHSFDIHFEKTEPTSFETYKSKNIIGIVEEKFDFSGKPELVATIGTRNPALKKGDGISGMAVSDDDVFIVYENHPDVSVYNSLTQKCMTQMTLTGFAHPVDLKHCASIAGNVYIVNGWSREILRIDKNRDFVKWSTGNDWGRLSVTAESTIIATCFKMSALKEYSQQGSLLREIKLCSTMVHPLHAIKLGNGQFVVSHGAFKDAVNRVCMVNDVGEITKSFGDKRGSSTQQVDVATCLAVDDEENILVLDRNNSRVLMLSPELEFRKKLLTKANGLRRPVAMHLDAKTGKLHIADNIWENRHWNDSKVLVFVIK